MGCIYKITNTVNGKAYIGQTRHDAEKTRRRDHFTGRGNADVKEDIEKYGKDVFTFEILHDGIIPELLNSFEKEAIAKFNCVHPNGYNKNRGGRGVVSHSDEAKEKISAVHKGKPLSEEHRLKLSKANKGKKHTAGSRRKMSDAHKGKTLSEETRQKMSESRKGRKHSNETKQKLSEALKGENNPMKRPEVRQKVSEANTNKKHSEETRRKISEANKGKSTHPIRPVAHQFFLSLPASLPKTEKNKRLYDQFPNICRGTIQRWTRRWQSELDE